MKKIFFIILLIFIFFEIYVREVSPVIHVSDKHIGWKLKKNLDLKIEQKDLLGKKYNVHFITNENGARFYGTKSNADLKILVIGDSFTNMPYASNDKMWFSVFADKFYQLCRDITKNWKQVQETCLVKCYDKQPTTDVVYALALKIMDPMNDKKIDFDFFKFVHNKKAVNKISRSVDTDDYLYPMITDNKLYVGGYKMNRLWHYHNKNIPEDLDARIL